MEKKDIHNIEKKYARVLDRLKRDRRLDKENKKIILQFLNECEMGKTIKHSQKKRIGINRLLKVSGLLKKMDSEWFKKPFRKITQQDMEKFIVELQNNRIMSVKEKPYSEESKGTIKKFIKKFYKWLYGNNSYPEIVDWIDTSVKRAEINALLREEVERLVERASSLRDKAVIMLLFDGGFRIEEFLNIKIGDVIRKDDYFMMRIRISKTRPRTISVPLCTKYLEEWLQMRKKEVKEEDISESFLFDLTYSNVAHIILRLGKKVLGKRVTPHILRHSSCTYYANLLGRYQLCYRYGWSMSSDSPDRYIDYNGIFEQETAQTVKIDETEKLLRENKKLQEAITRLKMRDDEIDQKINDFMGTLVKDEKFRKLVEELGLVEKVMKI